MDKLNKHKSSSGKDFAINLLIAFPLAVVIVSILKILGLKVGDPITGSVILFGLAYLIGVMRKKTEVETETEKFNPSMEIAKKWTMYVIVLVIPFSIYAAVTSPSFPFPQPFGLLVDFIWAFIIYFFLFGGITFVAVFLISALIRFLNKRKTQ